MAKSKEEMPVGIGFVGTVIAVIGGGAIYHWWTNDASVVQAFSNAPTATSTGYGALIAGLAALAVPNIPFVGPMIAKLFGSLTAALGIGKKIKDAIPPQLVIDLMAILKESGGKLSLADIEKLLAAFDQIDPAVILQLIRDAINAIRGGDGPAPKGVAGPVTSDIEVSV